MADNFLPIPYPEDEGKIIIVEGIFKFRCVRKMVDKDHQVFYWEQVDE